jgi:hypothetical protein
MNELEKLENTIQKILKYEREESENIEFRTSKSIQ